MKKAVLIVVCASILATLAGSAFPTLIAFADQLIEVSPSVYDFGDVELGTSVTTIITITNIDGHILIVYDIYLKAGSGPDFSITAPDLPVYIASGSSEEVYITYTPSSLGHHSAVLVIESDDPESPLIEVSLAGTCVSEAPPPVSVADILAFFDASVADGTLVGQGAGKSADGRLNALRNMIEAAGDLIEDGSIEEACQQLMDAYRRCDGEPRPPDFVAGPAAPTLAEMILTLVDSLGC